MATERDPNREIFSFHLVNLPLLRVPRFLASAPRYRLMTGLLHSERLFTMNLGQPVASPPRYNLRSAAMFAWWDSEESLDRFLNTPSGESVARGWHVRLHLYRRWGHLREIDAALADPARARAGAPVVAVTLARLRLSETSRFIRWGNRSRARCAITPESRSRSRPSGL